MQIVVAHPAIAQSESWRCLILLGTSSAPARGLTEVTVTKLERNGTFVLELGFLCAASAKARTAPQRTPAGNHWHAARELAGRNLAYN